jgi:hypothetical protein
MTIVVTAPESWAGAPGVLRLYLAGAIDQGSAPDWQADVIDAFGNRPGLVVLNPRRTSFDASALDEQIRWELDALAVADLILMWFPAGTSAPVSLLEAGLYMRSGKLVVGVEAAYERRRNVELTVQRHGVPLYGTLDELVQHALAAYTARTIDAGA